MVFEFILFLEKHVNSEIHKHYTVLACCSTCCVLRAMIVVIFLRKFDLRFKILPKKKGGGEESKISHKNRNSLLRKIKERP